MKVLYLISQPGLKSGYLAQIAIDAKQSVKIMLPATVEFDLDIRIPITTIEGRRLWDAVDILLDNLEDVAGAWIIYDDDSDKHLIFYPADKPQDFDLNCNSAYEACESVNDILSDLYQIRGTGSFTTLPTEREPTKWSAGYCRLVALAVGDAQ